jgi:hypothetical protein
MKASKSLSLLIFLSSLVALAMFTAIPYAKETQAA